MEDTSVFMIKEAPPAETDLMEKMGENYRLWIQLKEFVRLRYPGGPEEWTYPGKKYGWNFRIKDKKRAIIYLLPRDNYFKAAFVFGQKATDAIRASNISSAIKNELESSVKYAEGRGIRIDVKDETILPDIKKLVEIKLEY